MSRRKQFIRLIAATAIFIFSNVGASAAASSSYMVCYDDWTWQECQNSANQQCANTYCGGDLMCNWEGSCYMSAHTWSYCTSSSCDYYDS